MKGNRKPTREDMDIYGRRRSFLAKVNGGKVAIPESIREDLKIKDEDLVDVEVSKSYMTKRVRKELLEPYSTSANLVKR